MKGFEGERWLCIFVLVEDLGLKSIQGEKEELFNFPKAFKVAKVVNVTPGT